MSYISKINPNGTEYNLKDSTARTNIGNLSDLGTTEKTNLVSAINEVKSGLNNSWSLGGGNSIANNEDLNNITTVGNYFAATPTAATLLHCPTTGAFKLKVLYDVRETAPTYIEQVFNPMSSYDEYRRYKSGAAEWSEWHLTNCNLDEIKSGLTNVAYRYFFGITQGTHTITNLDAGDLIYFARYMKGIICIANNLGVENIVTPEDVGSISYNQSTKVLTFTKTSEYAGTVIVISASNRVTIDPS